MSEEAGSMENYYKEAAKGVSFSFIATILALVFQFATTIVLVRLLSVQDYGIYALLLASVAFVGIITGIFAPAIARFLPEWIAKKNFTAAKKLVKTALVYNLIIGLLVLAAMIFFPGFFSSIFKGEGFLPIYSLLFGLGLVFNLMAIVLDWALISLFEQKFRNIARVIYAFLVLALSLIALQSGFGLAGVLAAILAATIILFAITFAKTNSLLFSKHSTAQTGIGLKRIMRYSTISHALYLGDLFINLNVDLVLIGVFLGAGASGLYAFAVKIPQIIITYSPAVIGTAVLFPFILKKFSASKNKEQLGYFFRVYTRFTAFFTFPMAIAAIITAPEIIRFVFSEKYIGTIAVFSIAIIAYSVLSFRYAILTIYNTLEKPEIGIYARLVFIASTIASIYFLSAGKGIAFIIASTGIAMALMVLIEFLLTSRLIELKLPWKEILKISFNSAITALVLFFLKGLINGLAGLIAMLLIAMCVYLMASALNKPFNPRDRELFKKSGRIGRVAERFAE